MHACVWEEEKKYSFKFNNRIRMKWVFFCFSLLIKWEVSELFLSSTLDLICTSCLGVSAGLWPLNDTGSCLEKLTCSIVPTRKMNNEWIISLAFRLGALLSPYVSMYHLCSLHAAGVPPDLFTVSFHLWPFGIWKTICTPPSFFKILSLRFLFARPQRAKRSVVARQQI